MIEYNPPVPRIGFGIAAVVMSAITFSLMVVLPSALEQQTSTLAQRADPHRTAANPPAADTFDVPCAVAAAVNAPLFPRTATAADTKCKQPS